MIIVFVFWIMTLPAPPKNLKAFACSASNYVTWQEPSRVFDLPFSEIEIFHTA